MIHENDVDRLVLQEIDRLLARFREGDGDAVLLEQPLQGHPGGLGIIDDEGTLERHGDTLLYFAPLVQTPAA